MCRQHNLLFLWWISLWLFSITPHQPCTYSVHWAMPFVSSELSWKQRPKCSVFHGPVSMLRKWLLMLPGPFLCNFYIDPQLLSCLRSTDTRLPQLPVAEVCKHYYLHSVPERPFPFVSFCYHRLLSWCQSLFPRRILNLHWIHPVPFSRLQNCYSE